MLPKDVVETTLKEMIAAASESKDNPEAAKITEVAVAKAEEVASSLATASDVAVMQSIRQAALCGPEAASATIHEFARFRVKAASDCPGSACGLGCGSGCLAGCLIGGVVLVGIGAAAGTGAGAGTSIAIS
jgi:hypothetical protein